MSNEKWPKFFWAIVYVCMYIIALSPLHLFVILALYFWLFINNTIFVVFIFKTMKTKCTTVSIIVIQNMTIAERLVKRGASDRITPLALIVIERVIMEAARQSL